MGVGGDEEFFYYWSMHFGGGETGGGRDYGDGGSWGWGAEISRLPPSINSLKQTERSKS
jgi:hypothetical protein